MLISSAGLAGLTYGVIRAGQDGWSDTSLATMVAGAVGAGGVRRLGARVARRAGGQPLVDLSLFRSAGFTWGTALSTMV